MVPLEIEEKLKDTMTQEISLFSRYKEEFNNIKKFIIEKEWISLQRTVEDMKSISLKIEQYDTTRDILYKELCILTGSNDKDSFYSVISKVHKEGGEEIRDIYRIVKNEAKSIKVLNEGLNRFIQTKKSLVTEIIEELVPDRKGTIYNRKGFSSGDGNSSSLILNKHL